MLYDSTCTSENCVLYFNWKQNRKTLADRKLRGQGWGSEWQARTRWIHDWNYIIRTQFLFVTCISFSPHAVLIPRCHMLIKWLPLLQHHKFSYLRLAWRGKLALQKHKFKCLGTGLIGSDRSTQPWTNYYYQRNTIFWLTRLAHLTSQKWSSEFREPHRRKARGGGNWSCCRSEWTLSS